MQATPGTAPAPWLSRPWVLLALLVLANGIWGSGWVVAKVALRELTPLQIAGWRTVLAAALLLPLTWSHWRQGLLPRSAWPGLLALGGIGFFLSKLLSFWGIGRTGAMEGSLLMVLEPLFTLLLGWLLLAEPLGPAKLLSLLLGGSGACLIVFQGAWPFGPFAAGPGSGAEATGAVLGNLSIAAALLLEAIYSVAGKSRLRHVRPGPFTCATIIASTLFWIPALAADTVLHGWPRLSWFGAGAIVYYAVGGSIFGYGVWFLALRYVEASLVGLTVFLQLLVGTVLAAWVLGEGFTAATLAGGALVLVSLALTWAGMLRPRLPR